MQDDPGSKHITELRWHRDTRTSDIAPAIFEYSMKQLQTSHHSLRKEMVETHLFALCFTESNKTLDLPLEQG